MNTKTKPKKRLKPVIADPHVWLRYLSVSDAMKPYRPPRLKVDV